MIDMFIKGMNIDRYYVYHCQYCRYESERNETEHCCCCTFSGCPNCIGDHISDEHCECFHKMDPNEAIKIIMSELEINKDKIQNINIKNKIIDKLMELHYFIKEL